MNFKNSLSSFFFYLAIVLFVIGFSFMDNPVGNWYQQFLPDLGGRSITDIFFLDSLTGWSVANATNQNPDTTYVLKTTNGGDNWTIQYGKIRTGGGFPGYFKIYFLSQNTGFVSDVLGIDKSTDGGASWFSLNAPLNPYLDMSVLNNDTIWAVSSNPFGGGVFRTTNGGVSWQLQASFNPNPEHIYMLNGRIGFIAKNGTGGYVRKTIDSGTSWFIVDSGGFNGFTDMSFIDSLTGWRAISFMKKTTDGGLNWITQTLPFGGNIITPYANKISSINRDTLWANGGQVNYGGSQTRGMLYRTTNGGSNWLYQVPDTSINIFNYYHLKFVNKNIGWAYSTLTGVHTTNGGDPIFYTGIRQVLSEVPKQFQLFQNFPNPFNSNTKFEVLIASNVKRQTSEVKVRVYDITGREVSIVLDKKLAPGEYEITFDAKDLPSGIYFYSLVVDDAIIDTKKMILLK